MPQAIYLLCALTSIVCAGFLLRGYRRSRTRLLLWSAAGFVCFALANTVLFVDLVMIPQMDLSVWRNSLTLIGLVLLLRGLIWDAT
jgi:hydrogenase/urease accessory protein HupE